MKGKQMPPQELNMSDKEAAPYTPRNNASDTSQAQHQLTNDTPVDVNNNAVLARAQAETTMLVGKLFADNADRRSKLFDHVAAKMINT